MKELACRLHVPIGFQNPKVCDPKAGAKNYGHASKLAEGLGPIQPLPLRTYTDAVIGLDGKKHARQIHGGASLLAGRVAEANSTTQPGVPAFFDPKRAVR
jgi:hypothetical protein